jgi:hypothetical protein
VQRSTFVREIILTKSQAHKAFMLRSYGITGRPQRFPPSPSTASTTVAASDPHVAQLNKFPKPPGLAGSIWATPSVPSTTSTTIVPAAPRSLSLKGKLRGPRHSLTRSSLLLTRVLHQPSPAASIASPQRQLDHRKSRLLSPTHHRRREYPVAQASQSPLQSVRERLPSLAVSPARPIRPTMTSS